MICWADQDDAVGNAVVELVAAAIAVGESSSEIRSADTLDII